MATSFISRTLTSIREIAGEPSVHKKYSDSRLLLWIEQAYAHIMGEINRRAQNPLVVRHDVTLDEDKRLYVLPPIVQRILDMEMLDSSENRLWYVKPRSIYNPAGYGVKFEANTIRFSSDPTTDYILRLHFLPSACVKLHEGSIADDADVTNDTDSNNCTIVLDDSPTTGELDLRPNAYAGSILRILSANSNYYGQERVISSYDQTTHTATVEPAFDNVPTATLTYEIAPMIGEPVDLVVAAYVAKLLVTMDGDPARINSLNGVYRETLRDALAQVTHFNGLLEGIQRDSRFRGGFVSSVWNNLGNRG